MDVSSLGLATDLMLLRLGDSSIEDRGDHLIARTPDNPNYWWGNFIALPTPPPAADVPAWLQVFAEQFPDASHRTFAIDRAGPSQDWTPPWQEAGLRYTSPRRSSRTRCTSHRGPTGRPPTAH